MIQPLNVSMGIGYPGQQDRGLCEATVPEITGVDGACSETVEGQLWDDDGPLSALRVDPVPLTPRSDPASV